MKKTRKPHKMEARKLQLAEQNLVEKIQFPGSWIGHLAFT